MDGASIVGPPGPRGPPGRIEVLSSVSTARLEHVFSAFAKGERRLSTTSRMVVTQGARSWRLALAFLPTSTALGSAPTPVPLFSHTALLEHSSCWQHLQSREGLQQRGKGA